MRRIIENFKNSVFSRAPRWHLIMLKSGEIEFKQDFSINDGMIPFSIWSHGWQALEKNKWKIISISFKYQSHVTWDTRTPFRGKLSKTSVDRLISELYNCSARSFLQIGLEEIDFVFFRKPNTAR